MGRYLNGLSYGGRGSLYYRRRAIQERGWSRQAARRKRVNDLMKKAAALEANGEAYLAERTLAKALEVEAGKE